MELAVYDFPTQQHPINGHGKVQLSDPDFSIEGVGGDAYCFAGLDDELVIGASENKNLFVWTLPDGKGQDCKVNTSLCVLEGHSDCVRSVRCSNDKSVIISGGEDGVIKLWTSGAAR